MHRFLAACGLALFLALIACARLQSSGSPTGSPVDQGVPSDGPRDSAALDAGPSDGSASAETPAPDALAADAKPSTLTEPLVTRPAAGATILRVGDVNNDQRADLVTIYPTTKTIVVQLAKPSGGWGASQSVTHAKLGTPTGPPLLQDINGDSFADLVVAESCCAPMALNVLLNDGKGGFPNLTRLPLGQASSVVKEIASADFNGDAFADLAVTIPAENGVSVYIGSANGWNTRKDFAAGDNPTAIVAGKIDGDNHDDILVANSGVSRDTLTLLPGLGNGGFGAWTTLTVDGDPVGLALLDINGDGRLDIAAACRSSKTLATVLADPSGGFAPYASITTGWNNPSNALGRAPNKVFAVNAGSQSAYRDLLVTTGSGPFKLFRYLGGKVDRYIEFAVRPTNRENVDVGDVDGDGYLDLVVLSSSGTTQAVLRRAALGVYTPATPQSTPAPAQALAMALADLDGDKRPDVVLHNMLYPTGDNAVSVLLNDGKGTIGPASSVALPGGKSWGRTYLVTGDLDGDGDVDVVTKRNRGSDNTYVLLNDGQGNLKVSSTFTASEHGPMALGDFDGDGDLDLAIGRDPSDTAIRVYDGDKLGGFTPGVQAPVQIQSTNFRQLLAVDIDADGRDDLVSCHEANDGLWVYRSVGKVFGAPTSLGYGKCKAVAAGDVDGDGLLDLVVLTSSANQIELLRGQPNGTFAPPEGSPLAGTPSRLALGDFNGDGKLDVVVNDDNPYFIVALYDAMSGSFGSEIDRRYYPVGVRGSNADNVPPVLIGVGDLDGDGRHDLVGANPGWNNFVKSTEVTVLRGL